MLAPHIVEKMLTKRHGEKAISKYKSRNESVAQASLEYDTSTQEGENRTIYKFDHNVLGSESIDLADGKLAVTGLTPQISLELENPYSDMCE